MKTVDDSCVGMLVAGLALSASLTLGQGVNSPYPSQKARIQAAQLQVLVMMRSQQFEPFPPEFADRIPQTIDKHLAGGVPAAVILMP